MRSIILCITVNTFMLSRALLIQTALSVKILTDLANEFLFPFGLAKIEVAAYFRDPVFGLYKTYNRKEYWSI